MLKDLPFRSTATGIVSDGSVAFEFLSPSEFWLFLDGKAFAF